MNPYPTEDTLIDAVDGLCAFESLALQMQVHANDTLERRTLSQRFDLPAQLTVMLLLEGEVRVAINQTPCWMSARQGPVGYLWLMTAPGTLVRHIRAGQRVRKVNVTVPLSALEGIRLPAALQEVLCLDTPRPAVMSWAPTPHALRCAQEILSRREDDGLQALEACIAGLSMLQQALRAASECASGRQRTRGLAPADRDMARARLIRARLQGDVAQKTATPVALARELGMSESTLQRVFRAAYGTSIVAFQRQERLQRARVQLLAGGLTVGEVGYRAGYAKLSNFSSAFQRTFGYPPSACVRR